MRSTTSKVSSAALTALTTMVLFAGAACGVTSEGTAAPGSVSDSAARAAYTAADTIVVTAGTAADTTVATAETAADRAVPVSKPSSTGSVPVEPIEQSAAVESTATARAGSVPRASSGPPIVSGAGVAPDVDPCDLLTPEIASRILGLKVGTAITQSGAGNRTCGYRPSDPAVQGVVSLTLYSVTGTQAILISAAKTAFPDAVPVDGVGDAALLSVQGQAIGVLFGTTVFALGLFPQKADGQLLPVTKDDLISAAKAVLDGQ